VSGAAASVAKGKAKRNAQMNQRRGIKADKKPNAMEIEREMNRQARKKTDSAMKKEKAVREKKRGKKSTGPAAIFGGRTPSKAAVLAAVKGMEAAGHKVPEGHQVMITFIPAATAPAPAAKKQTPNKKTGGAGKNNNNNNNNNGKGKNAGGGRKKK
jgi:hypothetical protein